MIIASTIIIVLRFRYELLLPQQLKQIGSCWLDLAVMMSMRAQPTGNRFVQGTHNLACNTLFLPSARILACQSICTLVPLSRYESHNHGTE